MKEILAKFKEPSTWRGLIVVATACGIAVNPAVAEAIVLVGTTAVGLVEVFRKES